MSTLQLEISGVIATITLNRADKSNALNAQMWQSLIEHCQTVNQSNAKVLVLQAKGSRAFSAGADIAELKSIINHPKQMRTNNELVQLAQQKLEQLTIPTIALIDGICMGGGVGIACACDYRIATSQSKFAITPAKLGLLYSIEDSRRLVNLIGIAKAKELLLFNRTLLAVDALNFGLVNQVVESEQLHSAAQQLIEHTLQLSRTSLSGIKATLGYLGQTNTLAAADVRALFDRAFEGEDFQEGAAAFMDKRPAEF
ncbi:enoyl-CoA hydratase/isomerase family protein [Paraferrimonas sp. SM1919]|uniref:enoyl-CoA hydratase/isomerase family protein n=1 Tax=Paraferrimonas sp. SM1919 TaxID=2662263 RepID=UPI0013CFAC90|nr:enoyl-CoA hydratase/isomerase family protein [Paraferrimonas sp. SM1919]